MDIYIALYKITNSQYDKQNQSRRISTFIHNHHRRDITALTPDIYCCKAQLRMKGIIMKIFYFQMVGYGFMTGSIPLEINSSIGTLAKKVLKAFFNSGFCLKHSLYYIVQIESDSEDSAPSPLYVS